MLTFKEFLKKYHYDWYARIFAKRVDRIVVSGMASLDLEILEEGKWLKGSFQNIRVDRNTHLRSGDKHAHIHDRNGNELYAVTQDGKPSHGSKPFKLSKDQADVLANQGFNIPKNRIIEAVLVGRGQMLLLATEAMNEATEGVDNNRAAKPGASKRPEPRARALIMVFSSLPRVSRGRAYLLRVVLAFELHRTVPNTGSAP